VAVNIHTIHVVVVLVLHRAMGEAGFSDNGIDSTECELRVARLPDEVLPNDFEKEIVFFYFNKKFQI
jgi:hypothetical protein